MRRADLTCVMGAVGVLLAGWAPPTARAATLALYDFSPGAQSSDGDVSSVASAFSYDREVTTTYIDPYVGNLPASIAGITFFSTIGEAKRDAHEFSSTLTPAAGHAISLQSFRADLSALAINVNSFTAQLAVFTNLDNFTDPIYYNFATDATGNDYAISLWSVFTNHQLALNPLYQNVTTQIEFRYFAFGNDLSRFHIDNITITGTTTAVPEPGSAATVGALAALVVGHRRSRRA